MLTGRHNALPKESPKRNIQKEKIEKKIRGENISSILSFIYLGEGTNQRYVLWCSVVPKTPDSKIGVVGSTDTAWVRERILCSLYQEEILFSFFTYVSSPFLLETSGSFFKFNRFSFYLFFFLNLIFYLFICSLHTSAP